MCLCLRLNARLCVRVCGKKGCQAPLKPLKLPTKSAGAAALRSSPPRTDAPPAEPWLRRRLPARTWRALPHLSRWRWRWRGRRTLLRRTLATLAELRRTLRAGATPPAALERGASASASAASAPSPAAHSMMMSPSAGAAAAGAGTLRRGLSTSPASDRLVWWRWSRFIWHTPPPARTSRGT